MEVKIKVAGIDLTAKVRTESISIEDVITKQINTASFVIEDKLPYAVSVGSKDAVLICSQDELTNYFQGYVAQVELSIEGLTRLYHLFCQDATILTEATLVSETYIDMTDKAILQDLFAKYCSEIATSPRFGYLVVGAGGASGLAGWMLGSKYTSPAIAGVAESIAAYILNTSFPATGKVKLGIYKASDFSLVGYTAEWTVPHFFEGWHILPLVALVNIEASTDYWLVWRVNNSLVTTRRDSVGNQFNLTALAYGAAWPDPWTEALQTVKSYSFYCSYVGTMAIGATINRIIFNRISLRDAIERIASISGYDWYVDADKMFHYFAKETNLAPFGLSTSPNGSTTRPFSMQSYLRDSSQLVNRVTVQGGSYFSGDTTFYLAGNAENTELHLPYKMHAPSSASALQIWRNDGSDAVPVWTVLTVGTDYINDLISFDVLNNFNEKLLRFAVAPPNLLKAVKVIGRFDVPVLVRVRDDDSYAQYNRWYDSLIVDNEITDRTWAIQKGKAMLNDLAYEKEQGALSCLDDGLRSGQLLSIVDATRGLNDTYLLQRITTRFLGNGKSHYSVEFGEYKPSLVDMLVALKRKARQYAVDRDDEVLNDLLELSEDLTLADSAPTLAATGQDYYCDPGAATDAIVCGAWAVSP